MARIQILELPVDVAGTYANTPFAIIIDNVSEDDRLNEDVTQELMREALGAVGVIVTEGTLDVG